MTNPNLTEEQLKEQQTYALATRVRLHREKDYEPNNTARKGEKDRKN